MTVGYFMRWVEENRGNPRLVLNRAPAILAVLRGAARRQAYMRGENIWRKARGASGSCEFGTWLSARNAVLRDGDESTVLVGEDRTQGPP